MNWCGALGEIGEERYTLHLPLDYGDYSSRRNSHANHDDFRDFGWLPVYYIPTAGYSTARLDFSFGDYRR